MSTFTKHNTAGSRDPSKRLLQNRPAIALEALPVLVSQGASWKIARNGHQAHEHYFPDQQRRMTITGTASLVELEGVFVV